jgi:hypothetical protein
MKPATIFIVGSVLVVAIFAAEMYVAAIVFLLCCVTLLLILAGTLISVPSQTFGMRFPAAEPISQASQWPCLENVRLDPSREQAIEWRIETRGYGLLGAVGIGALCVMALVWTKHGNPFRPYLAVGETGDYVLFYFLAFVSFIPLSMAGAWFFERKLLASSRLTLGTLDPRAGAYSFCDQAGVHYGGTKKPMPPKPQDNICIVFYAPRNPEVSTSSAGMMFHRLRLLSPGGGAG